MHRASRPVSAFALACLAALAIGCATTSTSLVDELDPTPPAETTGSQVTPARPADAVASSKLSPVYFDTDRSLLREEAREALKHHARSIEAHPEWGVVTVEGHCDERGSEEYNLALGGRRAAVTAQYLIDLGVPASRLATRSKGEEAPAATGHDESSWRRNRRAELKSEAMEAAVR